jgi:hypothetical protein
VGQVYNELNKLDPEGSVDLLLVGMPQIKEVLHLMADSAVHDLRRSLKLGINLSDGSEMQLFDIINATCKVEVEGPGQVRVPFVLSSGRLEHFFLFSFCFMQI